MGDFLGGPVVKNPPCNAGDMGPGNQDPTCLAAKKNKKQKTNKQKNIKQKQCYNKFNKDFINDPHQKKMNALF